MTIPRLEFCAAGLLARLLHCLFNILFSRIQIKNVYAWTDSSIVLSWLNTPHVAYKVFVPNRIHQIHQLVPSGRWFYVSSDMNPADCASRGLRPEELVKFNLYWKGPEFLHQVGEKWSSDISMIPEEQLPEVQGSVVSHVVEVMGEQVEWYNRFSSFNRMLRIIIRLRYFIRRCREKSSIEGSQEYNDALMIVVKHSQALFLVPTVFTSGIIIQPSRFFPNSCSFISVHRQRGNHSSWWTVTSFIANRLSQISHFIVEVLTFITLDS